MNVKMYLFSIFATILIGVAACQSISTSPFVGLIEQRGGDPESTTILIERISDGKTWVHNAARTTTRYSPASTSKIPHTLIALETGAATPETGFTWDGQARAFAAWDQDQTLRQAYRRSAAWVYQVLAAEIGAETMQAWLTTFDYGNHDVGTGAQTTQYWLTGPLEISAKEQIAFLSGLAQEQLALSPETYLTGKSMFLAKTRDGHFLYAKTGWFHEETVMDIGWYVGWVEVEASSEIYVFALNMDMPSSADSKKRKPIIMDALAQIGAWPTTLD